MKNREEYLLARKKLAVEIASGVLNGSKDPIVAFRELLRIFEKGVLS